MTKTELHNGVSIEIDPQTINTETSKDDEVEKLVRRVEREPIVRDVISIQGEIYDKTEFTLRS